MILRISSLILIIFLWIILSSAQDVSGKAQNLQADFIQKEPEKTLGQNTTFIGSFFSATRKENPDSISSLIQSYAVGAPGDGRFKKLYYVNPRYRQDVRRYSILYNFFKKDVVDHGYDFKSKPLFILTADNFIGSILSGAFIGGIASLFADHKQRTFLYWSAGTFAVIFPFKQFRFGSLRKRSAVKMYGNWHEFSRIQREAEDLKNIQKFDRIGYYKHFLLQHPKGAAEEFVSSRIAYIEAERKEYKLAVKENTIESYSSFLNKYPNGKLLENAEVKLDSAIYSKVLAKNNLETFNSFIKKYPTSAHVYDARDRRNEFLYADAALKNTIAAYQEFLTIGGSDVFQDEARVKLAQLLQKEYSLVDQTNIDELKYFISNYPEASQVPEARKKAEQLILKKLSAENFKEQFRIEEIQPDSGEKIWFGSTTLVITHKAGKVEGRLDDSYFEGDNITYLGQIEPDKPDYGMLGRFPVPTAEYSILRFVGNAKFKGIEINGTNQNNPLSFMFVEKLGLVHIHGEGTVTLKNGESVILHD